MENKKLLKVANDALGIYEGGACNPRGIARAIVEACDVAAESGAGSDAGRDEYAPARLMLRQLNYLAGLGIGDGGNVEGDLKIIKGLLGMEGLS